MVNCEATSQGVVGEGSVAGVFPRVQSGGSMAEKPWSALVVAGNVLRCSTNVKFTHFPGSSYHSQNPANRSSL